MLQGVSHEYLTTKGKQNIIRNMNRYKIRKKEMGENEVFTAHEKTKYIHKERVFFL